MAAQGAPGAPSARASAKTCMVPHGSAGAHVTFPGIPNVSSRGSLVQVGKLSSPERRKELPENTQLTEHRWGLMLDHRVL